MNPNLPNASGAYSARIPSILDQVQMLPREHWLLYSGLLAAAIACGRAFDVTLTHVLFLGVALILISLHHGEYARDTQNEYDTIVDMWRSLPGPTTAFFLDANLIIFFYEMKEMGWAHDSGWQECMRQVNELLRRVQESEWLSFDKDPFYRASHVVYQRALFHFHALGFQSEYKQFYDRWKQAMPQLQSLLWFHLETIQQRCGVDRAFSTDVGMYEPALSEHTIPF